MSETQNVSAQLFTKQLPPSERASYYGCKNDFTSPNLTTCVNYEDSDTSIENAFQKQLDLSLVYKSPIVFDTIKKNFMDQTMENENSPDETIPEMTSEKELSEAKETVPVGPRDFLEGLIKETFGKNSAKWSIHLLVILVILILIIFFVLNK